MDLATRMPPSATAAVDWPGKMLSPTIHTSGRRRGAQASQQVGLGKPPTQPQARPREALEGDRGAGHDQGGRRAQVRHGDLGGAEHAVDIILFALFVAARIVAAQLPPGF